MESIVSNSVCKPRSAQRDAAVDGVAGGGGLLDGLEVRMPSSCSKCDCVTALISSQKDNATLTALCFCAARISVGFHPSQSAS